MTESKIVRDYAKMGAQLCRRIEAERAAGHAHVRAEAQRVRRELGLPR